MQLVGLEEDFLIVHVLQIYRDKRKRKEFNLDSYSLYPLAFLHMFPNNKTVL